MRNEHLKDCESLLNFHQSGKFSPNLVTLMELDKRFNTRKEFFCWKMSPCKIAFFFLVLFTDHSWPQIVHKSGFHICNYLTFLTGN